MSLIEAKTVIGSLIEFNFVATVRVDLPYTVTDSVHATTPGRHLVVRLPWEWGGNETRNNVWFISPRKIMKLQRGSSPQRRVTNTLDKSNILLSAGRHLTIPSFCKNYVDFAIHNTQ